MGDNHSAGATHSSGAGGMADSAQSTVAEGKGKGKAEAQDVSMGEEDSSSDEETGAEDEVSASAQRRTGRMGVGAIAEKGDWYANWES